MKIKMSLAFLAIYLVALIANIPAGMISHFVPQNSGVQVGQYSGTLWNGKVTQVDYRQQFQLQQLTWEFDWLALFTLQAKANVKFDNGRRVMTGSGVVSYGFSGVVASEVEVTLQSESLMSYLPLPVPVTPYGKFSLVIEKATQGTPYCGELDGYLVWHGAKVDTPMGNIDFATPSIDLSCEEGAAIASLKQHSEQITTNAEAQLTAGGNYHLTGTIIGSDKLEPSILQALSWAGRKNAAGETVLNFKGRL